MTITLCQIFAILPILIIGTTIIVIMLSIIYQRNAIRHIWLTMIGLILALITEFSMIWKNYDVHNINHLIYVDKLSIMYAILIMFSSLASIVLIYTKVLCQSSSYYDEFCLLLLTSSMGGILLTVSNHFSILFLGMELMTIPVFGLMSYSIVHKTSIEVCIKYIVLSVISSSFLLFGMAFIYAATGYLSFINIKEVLLMKNNIYMTAEQVMLFIMIGLSMMVVGFGFKLSFVPFHLWISDIYHRISPVVSMYLVTTSKVAIILVLIRFFLILPEEYSKVLYIFLSGSACCSMLFGSVIAMQHKNIKRILAYSSITNTGYLLAILITSHTSNYCIFQETMEIYLIGYILSNIGAFSIISVMSTVLSSEKDSDTLCAYRGLFWYDPILSVVFTVIILSLAGIPMTLGFISKFYLLLAGISNKLWCITIFIVLSSIVSIFYYLKIIINLYMFPKNNTSFSNSNQYTSVWRNTPAGVMSTMISVIILIFGLYPQPVIQLIDFICIE